MSPHPDAVFHALEGAGLIRCEVRGRTHFCRLDASPPSDAHKWLRAYERSWAGRLDELERLLRADDSKATHTQQRGRS